MSLALKSTAFAETSEPRLIAFLADDITRETVNRLVAQLGWRDATIGQGGIAAAAQTIDAAAPPALLLIDISDNEDPLSAMDALAEICPPATRVVTVGRSSVPRPPRRPRRRVSSRWSVRAAGSAPRRWWRASAGVSARSTSSVSPS